MDYNKLDDNDEKKREFGVEESQPMLFNQASPPSSPK